MLYAISLRHSSTFRVISKITLNSCLCGKVDSTLVRSDPKVLSSNLGPLIIFIFCKYNYMICVYLLKILVIGSKMAFCLSLWYLYLTIGGQGITKESEWKNYLELLSFIQENHVLFFDIVWFQIYHLFCLEVYEYGESVWCSCPKPI